MSIPFDYPAAPRTTIDIQEDRCITILWTIWHGWKGVLAAGEVDATWDEVSITGRLQCEMVRTVEDKDVWVWPGAESRSTTNLRKPDGITDIPIAFTSIREKQNDHGPHAIIECKLVAEDSAYLCREYVNEGVRRFVRGAKEDSQYPKYAAKHAFGFMAGYLLRGNAERAAKRINNYLDEAECLRSPTILREDWLRTSAHRRRRPLPPITLHHAFLAIHRTS